MSMRINSTMFLPNLLIFCKKNTLLGLVDKNVINSLLSV